MRKLIYVITLSFVLCLCACGNNTAEQITLPLSDEIEKVEVKYYYAGQITEWELEADEIVTWVIWAESLSLKTLTENEIEELNQPTEGGAIYDFIINDGEMMFSYSDHGDMGAEKYRYVSFDGEQYRVIKPTDPF